MSWSAIYRETDGVLVSVGSVVADTLPAGLAVKTYVNRPDQGKRWNPSTLTFQAIPPEVLIDRLQDAKDHPSMQALWASLDTQQRTVLRKFVVWLIGGKRYRQEGEEVSIDVEPDWPSDPSEVIE